MMQSITDAAVEKVARAIAFAQGGKIVGPGQSRATREFSWKMDGDHFEKYAKAHWQEYKTAASFAIEAMREMME